MEEETPPFETNGFVVVAATLGLMALVPAAFWLADESLLPWAEELRWEDLRAEEHVGEALPGFVELSRSGCFGRCPIYSVRLFTSGRVEFEGIGFACVLGHQSAQVEQDLAHELVADIADAGFFDTSWNRGSFIADASDSELTLQYGGQRRTLPNIDADSNSPRLLRRMASAVDEVAETSRWLPKRVGKQHRCADTGR